MARRAGSRKLAVCPPPVAIRVAKAYLNAMGNRSFKSSTVGTVALIAVLLALLVATAWYAARTWIAVSGPPMPATGYIAMALGVVFSLLLGIGLMSLLFYSSRHGYDEPSRLSRREDDGD